MSDFNKLVLFPNINFIIFVGIVVFAARKPLTNYFKEKLSSFSKGKKTAQQEFADASKDHEEVFSRLENLENEVKQMSERAQQASSQEVENIRQQAESLGAHLQEETKRVADAEVNRATGDLRKQLIDDLMSKVNERLGGKAGAEHGSVMKSAISDFKELGITEIADS